MNIRVVIGALILGIALVSHCAAQVLRGVVVDEHNKGVPSLNVKLTPHSGEEIITLTDTEGKFAIGVPTNDTYIVEIAQGPRILFRQKVRATELVAQPLRVSVQDSASTDVSEFRIDERSEAVIGNQPKVTFYMKKFAVPKGRIVRTIKWYPTLEQNVRDLRWQPVSNGTEVEVRFGLLAGPSDEAPLGRIQGKLVVMHAAD